MACVRVRVRAALLVEVREVGPLRVIPDSRLECVNALVEIDLNFAEQRQRLRKFNALDADACLERDGVGSLVLPVRKAHVVNLDAIEELRNQNSESEFDTSEASDISEVTTDEQSEVDLNADVALESDQSLGDGLQVDTSAEETTNS